VRASTLLVLAAVVGGASLTYGLMKPPGGPPEPAEPSEKAKPTSDEGDPRRPTPTTGTLIIRVRTPDAVPLPAGARAGYVAGTVRRLRPAAADGTFRFSDAPLGKLEVVAEAEGYRAGSTVAVVQALVPAEVLVTLEPRP
jgi:hypothetical protein